MLRFAKIGSELIADETRESLDTDVKLMLALTKAVEIVGEAANQVSDETRSHLPQLPWRAMIGMRHILVHEYFAVDLDLLWSTVFTYLPLLAATIEAVLSDGVDDPN